MKRNYIKTILSLFALALIIFGGNVAGDAQANPQAQLQYRRMRDYTGDGKADPTIVRYENGYNGAGEGVFWTLDATNNSYTATRWGVGTDRVVLGDFDGDGKGDRAVVRNTGSTITWYILQSRDGFRAVAFGSPSGDYLVPGDYDGDGKTDIAVSRINYISGSNPSGTLDWYILRSSNNQIQLQRMGIEGTTSGNIRPIPTPYIDYDGDGKQDFVLRASVINAPSPAYVYWAVLRSSDQRTERIYWGAYGDQLAAGDYDGDGRTDFAVVRRQATEDGFLDWYIRYSSTGATRNIQFGRRSNYTYSREYDYLVPADYDGDGKTDIAVHRVSGCDCTPQSSGYFYILRSSTNALQTVQWGYTLGDIAPMSFSNGYEFTIF